MPPTLPDNLTADDLLLLHLAGELPPEAAAAVDARLVAEQAARELRDAWLALDGPLAADAAAIAVPSAGSAARAVVRAMRDTAVVPVPRFRRWRLRPPMWTLYPAAAAAVLALGMFGWWYNVHDEFTRVDPADRPDTGPPVLVLRGSPDEDLATQSDEQIAQQFDSIIAGNGGGGGVGGVDFQMAALDFLEKSIQ